jgi:hypothetical protein
MLSVCARVFTGTVMMAQHDGGSCSSSTCGTDASQRPPILNSVNMGRNCSGTSSISRATDWAVVLFESLRRDTEQVVRRIWEFLEIQPGIVRRLNLEPRNMANTSKRQPNLPVDLKEWVSRYYRDSNQLVEELLGIDVSAWSWDG